MDWKDKMMFLATYLYLLSDVFFCDMVRVIEYFFKNKMRSLRCLGCAHLKKTLKNVPFFLILELVRSFDGDIKPAN